MKTVDVVLKYNGETINFSGVLDGNENDIYTLDGTSFYSYMKALGYDWFTKEMGSINAYYFSEGVEVESSCQPAHVYMRGMLKIPKKGDFDEIVQFKINVTDSNYMLLFDYDNGNNGVIKHTENSGYINKVALIKALGVLVNQNAEKSHARALPWHTLHPTLLTMLVRDIHYAVHSGCKGDMRYPEFFRNPLNMPVV